MRVLLQSENTKRKSGGRDYLAAGKTEKEAETLGDRRPDFLYTL